jgi:putative flippase GtrA
MINGPWITRLRGLARYGVVGVLNNLLGYLIYILVTLLWLDAKVAVTLMYPIGAVTAYFGHARYSFAYSGRTSFSVVRYSIAHMIGYGVNISLLYLLSDLLGYPHQLVQAAAIISVGGILYLLFRHFVFPNYSQLS